MSTLVIHSPTSRPLRTWMEPGCYTVGRGARNVIEVDHPSLSEVHCELEIRENGQMHVKDLGSSEGTCVNDQPVLEADVPPGGVVQAGEVRLWIEMLPHEDAEEPSDLGPREAEIPVPPPASFFAAIPDAFAYALQLEFLLLIGAAVLLQNLPLMLPGVLRYLDWIVGALLSVYLITIFRDIVLSTADGFERIPAFNRSMLDWDGTKQLVLHCFLLGILCFGPSSVSRWWLGTPAWIPTLLFAAGCMYFPTAFLGILMADCLSSANPVVVFRSWRIAPFANGFLAVTLAAGLGMPFVLDEAWNEPQAAQVIQISRVIAEALLSACAVYLSFVWMRCLGQFYRCYPMQASLVSPK
jgi:hypothetical protein